MLYASGFASAFGTSASAAFGAVASAFGAGAVSAAFGAAGAAGFFTTGRLPVIAPVGHFWAQIPQSLQFSFITARSFTIWMPSNGQLRSHIPQAIHPVAQASLTALPFRWFWQATLCFFLYGTRSMMCFGQAYMQAPQATHFSLSTTATPFTIWIASNAQAFTQVP